MTSIWKPIPNYTNYEASMFGEVRNKHTRRILKPSNCNGYSKICLRSDNNTTKSIKLHRIIASLFIPNPENKPEVNHKSKPNTNNHVNNLEWVTKSENAVHSLLTDNKIRVNIQPLKFENDTEILYFRSYGMACEHFERCIGTIWGAVKNQEVNSKYRWRDYKITKISVEEYNAIVAENP